jgi:1-acyl-sn-glycerol-3-phosphate acyltransferase
LSAGAFKPWSFWGRSTPKETLVVLDAVYPSQYIRRNEQGEITIESAKAFAQGVREIMQAEIDQRGGTQAFYRGHMKRLKGINA